MVNHCNLSDTQPSIQLLQLSCPMDDGKKLRSKSKNYLLRSSKHPSCHRNKQWCTGAATGIDFLLSKM